MQSDHLLSIIIPCYNEEKTLAKCLARVLGMADNQLSLEIIIVDDGSKDNSFAVAQDLAKAHNCVRILRHECNKGKGAALKTGFKEARGQYVAVQDADLEYDPQDLKKMLAPLTSNEADVVLGSRFLSPGYHRVLFFWHTLANQFLTFLSNMFTDLNLTDMECCYKVFRREIIQKIDINEASFGVEPELVAKVAYMRCRIYEMGVSYRGRTYEEGKKIGLKDAFRALYCIIHYNAPHAPVPIQFLFYTVIGTTAAIVNLLIFLGLLQMQWGTAEAAVAAFIIAAIVNYFLCITFIFRHNARWSSGYEIGMFILVVLSVCFFDVTVTKHLIASGTSPIVAKVIATFWGLFLNFLGRRYLVFPEASSGPWKKQEN